MTVSRYWSVGYYMRWTTYHGPDAAARNTQRAPAPVGVVAIRPPCDEAVIRAGPSAAQCERRLGPWILAATILGSSMVFIDGTVVNVALPALQDAFGATAADAQWIVESYALLLAALLLVGGALGDRYGRRRVFMIGVVLFAAASAWCGLASDLGQLITARAAQGVGGALLVPGSLAIISASFAEAERGKAIGTWSGFTAITAAFGPVLGGWLVENASWRWVFYINIPITLIVLAIVLTRVPESRDEAAGGPLDWLGSLLVTVGLGGLVFGLIEAGALGLGHPKVLIALTIGAAALGGFITAEARAVAPMMPLAFFRSRTFAGANLLTFLLYAALGGIIFFLPFNLIQVQGYTATAAGAAFLPLIGLMFVLSRWAGGLVARYGSRFPLIVGPSVAALGFAMMALPGVGGSYWTTFFPSIVVMGIGMSISVAPLTTVVMGAVDVRHSGVASGVNNAVSRAAALIAIAALGLVMTASFGQVLDTRLARADVGVEIAAELAGQHDRWASAGVGAADAGEQAVVKSVVAAAFVDGFRRVALVAATLSVLGAVSAAAWIGERAA